MRYKAAGLQVKSVSVSARANENVKQNVGFRVKTKKWRCYPWAVTVKVKLYLCLTKHYVMKTYWRVEV